MDQRRGLAKHETETSGSRTPPEAAPRGRALLPGRGAPRCERSPEPPLGHAREALDGAVGLVGPRVVIGEPGVSLVEAPLVEPLERDGDGRVQRVPLGDRQAVVHDLLRERVLEHVDGLRGTRLLVQELEPRQLPEVRLEVARPAPHCLEEPERDLPPDHRGQAQRVLHVLGEAVDARPQRLLDGVRHRDRRGLRLLADGPAELLEEERVALGLAQIAGARASRASRGPRSDSTMRWLSPRESGWSESWVA